MSNTALAYIDEIDTYQEDLPPYVFFGKEETIPPIKNEPVKTPDLEVVTVHIEEKQTSTFEEVELKSSVPKVLKSKTLARAPDIEKIEAEYWCVISNINEESQKIEARVYDKDEKIQVMVISIDISSFPKDDQHLIHENAIFYWKIGSRAEVVKSKSEKVRRVTKNFSEYKMRRLYVSKRMLEGRLNSQVEKFKKVFSL